MNVLKIYSIHDTAVAAYAAPFYGANDLVAIRVLTGLVNNPETSYSVQPSDFTLYCIGSFDIKTGEIIAENPRRVRNGLACVEQRDLFDKDAAVSQLQASLGLEENENG